MHIFCRHFSGLCPGDKIHDLLANILHEIREDLQHDISGAQQLLLGSVRTKLIVLLQIADFIDDQESLINGKGELLPCLSQSYLSYTESLRRDLQGLFDLANKKPTKQPDLQKYLKVAYSSEKK